MENKIYRITNKELSLVRKQLEKEVNWWVGEIDGELIEDWNDYVQTISKVMQFPMPCKVFEGYIDWITDLDWLEADGYVLIIRNFESFMSKDLEKKKIVVEAFEEDIFPWWAGDVEKYVVGGKAKPFNVYLVDEDIKSAAEKIQ